MNTLRALFAILGPAAYLAVADVTSVRTAWRVYGATVAAAVLIAAGVAVGSSTDEDDA